MTPPMEAPDAFARISGLILFDASLCAWAPKLQDYELFLGYDAVGFGAASILAILTNRRAGLLRAEAKPYGLQRLIETSGELSNVSVCLVYASDVSAVARQAIVGLDVHELHLGEARERPQWTCKPLNLSQAETKCSSTPLPPTYERENGYVLSSGITRRTYMDVFSTLLDPQVSLAYAASAKLESYDSIIGMANGGIFFATTLSLATGKQPIVMDHGKVDRSLIPASLNLGRALLADETVGSGDYFRIATAKLAEATSSIDYLAAVRFRHRGEYEFPIMFGAAL